MRERSRVRLVLVALIVLSRCIATAQDDDSPGSALAEGSYALLFQVTGNFTLGPFQGGALAGKYHFTPLRALRLTLGGRLADNDASSLFTLPGDTTGVGTISMTNGSETFELQAGLHYLWYLPTIEDLHLFAGLGPEFAYRNTSTQSSIVTFQAGQWTGEERETTGRTWSAGLGGILGLEWVFARSFALQAEYGLLALYSWTSFSEGRLIPGRALPEERETGSGKAWNITTDRFRFGLTAYF